MEIYRNSVASKRKVNLAFPIAPETVEIFIEREGELPVELTNASVEVTADTYSLTIPLNLTHIDSEFMVRWDITYIDEDETFSVTERTPVTVVTPILTDTEIRAIDANIFADPFEVVKIEKAVRHIIQAYTGQEFGHYSGSHTVSGSGSSALFLPQRLLEITEFNGIPTSSQQFVIASDGHTLRLPPTPWVPVIKEDTFGWHMHTGGVIHNPNNVRLKIFDSANLFSIKGRWGWETVPAAVKEAAKLLVNDYACADSQYRDRYLVSMTAADWRIQFNSGAYLRTGNVRADQLLADYVVTRGWGII